MTRKRFLTLEILDQDGTKRKLSTWNFLFVPTGIFSFVPIVPNGIFSKNGVRSTGTKKQKRSNFQVGTFPCGMGLRNCFDD